jgi:hypothetical protein
VKAPTLHLNGSAADNLIDDLANTTAALREALRKMEFAAPNARDYYPQGDGAFRAAMVEHVARVERVRAVLTEYESIFESVADQRDARDARRGR